MNTKDEQEEHVVWLCDFRGWAISSTPLSVTRESMHIIQNYYAGMIAVAILSNPPRIFESFWKVLLNYKFNYTIFQYCYWWTSTGSWNGRLPRSYGGSSPVTIADNGLTLHYTFVSLLFKNLSW